MRFPGAALLAAVLASWTAPAAADSIGPGVRAPEAAGIVINGPEGTRVSTLLGRVLVVEFWASWCGPCIESIPRLQALRHEVHKSGFGADFEILGVGLDKRVEDARRFLSVRPVSYPVVVDTLGIASANYGVWRLPATFLVDRSGEIRQIYHGYGPGFGEDLRQRVFELLRDRHSPTDSRPPDAAVSMQAPRPDP
ncbi:TlpA disulfide reductase family protein [Fontimonas sp. SYSU GA230001]|uniref:TlpA family protein disulfide reductase n=1 Tax=Fontimonas sp. SYSU GA230001 TaxID=3142450 RepID=UPI0032B42435